MSPSRSLCRHPASQPARSLCQVLCSQQRRSLTKQLDHRPVFSSGPSSGHPVTRFASPMRGSYFCGPSKTPHLVGRLGHGILFQYCVSSPQVSHSVNQSMAGRARVLLDPLPSSSPGLIFLGVLLVHVPRFSSTRTSTQVDKALPASERSTGWSPLAAAPLGYLHQLPARPDQNLSCSCSIWSGWLAGQPALPAYAERSNKGGIALTLARCTAMTS